MAGNAVNKKILSFGTAFIEKIAENSLVVEQSDLIIMDGGFIAFAGAGDTIEGVSQSLKTFDADNETVAKEKVLYRKTNSKDMYKLKVSAASLADADIGSFFDIVNTTQLVDYATKSITTGQLRLEEITTTQYGVFTIVNK